MRRCTYFWQNNKNTVPAPLAVIFSLKTVNSLKNNERASMLAPRNARCRSLRHPGPDSARSRPEPLSDPRSPGARLAFCAPLLLAAVLTLDRGRRGSNSTFLRKNSLSENIIPDHVFVFEPKPPLYTNHTHTPRNASTAAAGRSGRRSCRGERGPPRHPRAGFAPRAPQHTLPRRNPGPRRPGALPAPATAGAPPH